MTTSTLTAYAVKRKRKRAKAKSVLKRRKLADLAVEARPSTTYDFVGDGTGRHIPGTPYVFRHGWIPIDTDAARKARKQQTESRVTLKVETETRPAAARAFLQQADNERLSFYKEEGLDSKFPDETDEQLLSRWKSSSDNKEKGAIHSELEARMKRLTVVAESIDRAILDERREDRKDSLRHLTERLEKLPAGKHLKKLADKLTTDKVLDRVEGVGEFIRTHGKEYAGHMAIVVALSTFLGPLAGAIGGAIGGEALQHAIEHLMHNKFIDAAIWVTLAAKLEPLLGPVFENFGRAAKLRRVVKAKYVEA